MWELTLTTLYSHSRVLGLGLNDEPFVGKSFCAEVPLGGSLCNRSQRLRPLGAAESQMGRVWGLCPILLAEEWRTSRPEGKSPQVTGLLGVYTDPTRIGPQQALCQT